MVIGTDALEDPVIVDLRSEDMEVMTAEHGDGSCRTRMLIADSLENFQQIVASLQKLAKGRNTLDLLEDNPISGLRARAIHGRRLRKTTLNLKPATGSTT